MNKAHRLIWMGLVVLLVASVTAQAQRPRTVQTTDTSNTTTTTTTPPPLAPQTIKVKYEGGVFGYNKKMDGTITFDDANRRLLFRNNAQQEVLSIPYASIASAFADTKSKRPTATNVLSRVSIYTLPAMLYKKKYRYLTMQYSDPDTSMSGTTSFKMENADILNSALYTLAQKAGLTQRGDVYVRRKDTTATTGGQQP